MRQLFWLLVLACAGVAQAGLTFSFECLSNKSATNAAIGSRQLSMEVFETDEQVFFRFLNEGPEACVIAQIYVYGGVLLESPLVIDDCPGVDFKDAGEKVSPGSLPGYNPGPDLLNGFSAYTANNPAPRNGVGPGEWVTLRFDLRQGADWEALLDRFQEGTMVVGLHVQAFSAGSSESFISTWTQENPIPEPATMTLLALSGLAFFRRRKHAA